MLSALPFNGSGRRHAPLTRGRPLIAAFPRVVTHAQAQLAVELAQRGIDVIVGSERATFAQLVDDPTSIGRILEGANV